MPLKRFLSGLNTSQSLPGDVTTDAWEPVPATAAALPEDTFDWLQGDPAPQEPTHPFVPLEEEEHEHPPDYLQCFSAEELAIIEQQKAETEAGEVEPEPEPLFKIPTKPQPEPPQPQPARELVERKADPPPPQPRRRVLSERGRWIEVVKNAGEHLSELELKIIRKQLASS